MSLWRRLLLGSVAVVWISSPTQAQTATQMVRFQVDAIRQIGVTGSPAPLVISTSTAGSEPTSVSANGATYAITTNETNQKITASIDQAMPPGVTLEVQLTPPVGASSAGSVTLNTSATDVITGISHIAASALPITYTLRATPSAQVAPAARTVTFTIVSGS